MGLRKTSFVNGEIYHVCNRAVAGIPVFQRQKEAELFLESALFYLQEDPPTRFSIYRTSRDRFSISSGNHIVTPLAFCIMPNHFHFLLKQNIDKGIQTFIKKISNSYAHYYGLKHSMKGHVFEGNFCAIHIEDEEQLLHVSRYIHLNPVTAYLVETPEAYAFSSYRDYITSTHSSFIDPSLILSSFRSRLAYKRFVDDQKDYQRTLARAKYLTLE